ncbi:NADH-dependent butanol dehydrogenase A [Fibrobacter succinogenes]|nr:iron-containing alcohol dehydrogenase [Fibrobacter succinogenes]MCL4100774.1 NADH-dependent butanol dehydrogenase A [Fibrobacter succinogenes]
MNNFTFYSPTEFVFGRSTESQVGELCLKHGASRVMIIYGGGSVVRSGLLDRVKSALTAAGIAFTEMGGVQPNPIDTKVREGLKIAREFKPDFCCP